MRCTHFGPGTGAPALGGTYYSRHCASRRFLGKIIDIHWTHPISKKKMVMRRVPVMDICKSWDVVDLPTAWFRDFFRDYPQPRGGHIIDVVVVGKVRRRVR